MKLKQKIKIEKLFYVNSAFEISKHRKKKNKIEL